ncbi:hypothetical protein POVWA2_026950 [Plasmodium ovale wallikeri]|uniref:Uncharacterized protein n=1 Tax=Plasmodium ovale wallikeri TaxID=864142 RepID=A0A1A8YW10_PLAOA|nr:hypothetical protein POVWA1_026980 [Plasmodium ovale wallikeri]SBT35819.1 hypothetical protein POVWA2_026950 [Plasmodium ovale wallikeri]
MLIAPSCEKPSTRMHYTQWRYRKERRTCNSSNATSLEQKNSLKNSQHAMACAGKLRWLSHMERRDSTSVVVATPLLLWWC